MDATHGLLRSNTVRTGRKPSPFRLHGSSLILDPIGIFNGTAKHLKTAADADEGNAVFTEPAKFLGKTSTVKPFQIVKGLLAAGQDE